MRTIKVAAATALLVLATACGDDSGDDAAGDGEGGAAATSAPAVTEPAVTYPPNGEVAEVLSIDNTFLPGVLTVAAGTEVKFVNNGRNDHNVVPEGDLDVSTWGVLEDGFHQGDTYSYVFTTPGTYVYYCTIHGTSTVGMFGSVVVTEP